MGVGGQPYTPAALTPAKTPGTHFAGGWVPGPTWRGAESPALTGTRSPDHEAYGE